MANELADETARPVYKYTLTDQYGKEYEVIGYSERLNGKTLIVETPFDGERPYQQTKIGKNGCFPQMVLCHFSVMAKQFDCCGFCA